MTDGTSGPAPAGAAWQVAAHRMRHLQLAQLAILVLLGGAVLALTVVFVGRIRAENDQRRAADAQTAALSALQWRMQIVETGFWRDRATGGVGLSTGFLADIAGVDRELRRLAAAQEDLGGAAATAAARRALAGWEGVLSQIVRRVGRAGSGGLSRLRVDEVYPGIESLRRSLLAWWKVVSADAGDAGAAADDLAARLMWTLAGLIAALTAIGVAAWMLLDRARARAMMAVSASEERFRSLVQNSSDMVLVVSPAGAILYASPPVGRILGRDTEALVGSALADIVEVGDHAALGAIAGRPGTAAPDPDEAIEARMRMAGGGWRMVEMLVSDRRVDPVIRAWVLNARDVTERHEAEQRLVHQAFHDGLTGLPNRALFEDRVAHALRRRRREGSCVSVLLLDLDDFKTVNDSLGHAAGDLLLSEIAHRIEGCLRSDDTPARLGGDEFAVLLEGVPCEGDAPRTAARIIDAVGAPVSVAGQEVVVQASVGVATTVNGSSMDAGGLIRRADLAMYAAKDRGKGRFALFAPEMAASVRRRLDVVTDLHHALDRGELTLHFQPIVMLGDGRPVGAEALLRWRQPGGLLVPPSEFLGIAEDTGLIHPIGRWVLGEACRQAAGWPAGPDGAPYVSVNLAARQVDRPDLPAVVEEALASSGLPPGRLVVEVTEQALLRDVEQAAEALRSLRDAGVRVAIDDFGTGYSSLSYLGQLPVDILKIDRLFVRRIEGHTRDMGLAAVVVRLAEVLGLTAVAEGIEHPGQAERLRALGCEMGQGFLFSPPMADDAIGPWLASAAGREAVGAR